MGFFSSGNKNKCQVCGNGNCGNPVHVRQGLQMEADRLKNEGGPAASGRLRPSGVVPDKPLRGGLGSKNDAKYEKHKTRQDNEGKPHLVRHLPSDKDGKRALKQMVDSGAVDHSETNGRVIRVVLKKGFAKEWTEYGA